MDEGEVIGSLGGRDAQYRRKRVRSGDSDGEDTPGVPEAVPVTKKVSVSAIDLTRVVLSNQMDRVALLDAGAQYGKV